MQVDAHPFKHWYESHYGVTIGIKKGKKAPPKEEADVRNSLCGLITTPNVYKMFQVVKSK